MFIIIVISLVTLIITLTYIWIKNAYSFFEKRGIPYTKPTFPLGNLKGIGKEHMSVMVKRFYDEFKKTKDVIAGFYSFTSSTMLIMNLDLAKNILIRDFSNFTDRGIYINEKDDPLSAHLFSMEGAKWKHLRAKISPTFTSGKMKMMFHTILKVGDELKKHLEPIASSNTDVEVKEILSRYSTDVIGTCAFGIDCNSLVDPEAEFRKMGLRVFQLSTNQLIKASLIFFFRDIAKFLRAVTTDKTVSDFFLRVIYETVEYREKNSIERNDFMDLMIKLKNHKDESERITINELAAQAFIFFTAGYETSSNAITFCLYELAMNQDIQEKLRNEILKAIEKYNGVITYEAVLDVPYLDQVIDETLRKYPAVFTLMRIADQDYKIPNSNHVIPKGMTVMLPIYSFHHDPEYYPDPEKFDPERFSTDNKSTRNQFSYLPFGEGPRNCIGLRFGYMQTRIGLIKSLLGFKYSPCEKTPKTIVLDPNNTFLAAKDGLWLRIEKV